MNRIALIGCLMLAGCSGGGGRTGPRYHVEMHGADGSRRWETDGFSLNGAFVFFTDEDGTYRCISGDIVISDRRPGPPKAKGPGPR